MRKIATAIAEAAIFVIGSIVAGVYRPFFGWWLDDLMNKRYEDKLKDQIRHALAFLFDDHGATFVPNDSGYEWTKGKMVTLEAGNVRFRISRDRNEDGAEIAPLHVPSDWRSLVTALVAVTAKTKPVRSKDDLPRYPVFPDLFELGEWLKPHFRQLAQAYSIDNYAETKLAIQMVECFPDFAPPSLGRFVRTAAGRIEKKTIQGLGL